MKPVDLLSDDEFAHVVQGAVNAVLKRVQAALTFDSWASGPLAFGVRGVPSDTRHLLFSAMGRDIDLRITPAAGAFALTGQILGPDESGIIELADESAAGRAGARVTALDELGEFRLDGVGTGTYVLTLRLGDDELVLPPLHVGEHRR